MRERRGKVNSNDSRLNIPLLVGSMSELRENNNNNLMCVRDALEQLIDNTHPPSLIFLVLLCSSSWLRAFDPHDLFWLIFFLFFSSSAKCTQQVEARDDHPRRVFCADGGA
jgi:hypothetical protein